MPIEHNYVLCCNQTLLVDTQVKLLLAEAICSNCLHDLFLPVHVGVCLVRLGDMVFPSENLCLVIIRLSSKTTAVARGVQQCLNEAAAEATCRIVTNCQICDDSSISIHTLQ